MLDFIKGLIEKFIDPTQGTRFKGFVFLIIIMAFEACLATIWTAFPLTTICGFEAGLYVTLVTGKTVNNSAYSKNNNGEDNGSVDK
jgi:hypothetical protein